MDEIKEYTNQIINEFDFEQIKELLARVENLNVLIIGDTIIDRYSFVSQRGRATKDPILSVEYKNDEFYAGGILAIANHLSSFVKSIKLITLIGDQNSMIEMIKKSIKSNIDLKTFTKTNAPTTVKRRMIDFYRRNKLFKIEYINDRPISGNLSQEIIDYLDKEIPKYDLVLVGDFGHGFLNKEIRKKLEQASKFLCINVQSNSSNFGFNYFTLYNKFDFICMNEDELRLPLLMRFENIEDVIMAAQNKFKIEKLLVTQGKHGCIFSDKNKLFRAPILITSVIDTTGAGDAVFSIASLCEYAGIDNNLLPFIANCAGGIASNILGNKESITKERLLKFIKNIYEYGMGKI